MIRPKRWLKGIIIPMITPFDASEEVDDEALGGFTDWLLDQGVHGLFASSCTGEMAKLKLDERKEVIKVVVDRANGKIPVLAGAGDVSTKNTTELIKYANDVGADAAVVLTPYFFRHDDDILLDHFRTLASQTELPLVLYDNPDSNNTLSAKLVARIVEHVNNVIAIKDSSFDFVKLLKEIEMVGDRISVIQGIEQLLVPSLVMGASGGILGIGNVCPRFLVDIYDRFMKGDMKEAAEMQIRLLTLCDATEKYGYEAFIKAAVAALGHPVGRPRKPSHIIDAHEGEEVRRILAEFGLL